MTVVMKVVTKADCLDGLWVVYLVATKAVSLVDMLVGHSVALSVGNLAAKWVARMAEQMVEQMVA